MKKCLLLFIALFLWTIGILKAQTEQLLVNENFQAWTNFTASTASPSTSVALPTLISNETLTYSLYGISVVNSGYASGASTTVTTPGYLKMAKTTEVTSGTMSIILSPLKSITRITFVETTTGSSRGFQVWKKNASDADWVSIYSTSAGTTSGTVVNLTLNDANVSLKFTNLAATQNAYLTDLKIWGNVTGVAIPATVTSLTPANNATIPTSGSLFVVFSENVTRATANDITLGGVAIHESNILINGATVTINYSGLNTDSSYGLVIPAGAFKNAAGTPTGSSTTATYKTPDTIAPTLTKMTISNGSTLPVNGFISLVMSEPCMAGTAMITLGTKTITAAVSASNNNLLYINYSGLAYDTDYTVTIPSNAITDLSGNSYAGTTVTFHTEVDGKGNELFNFTPDVTSVPTTSAGTVPETINMYTISFDGVASAGARSSSPYTYAFKTNFVLLPTLPSVGELSFYIQSGGGTVPQEYYIQKLASDGTTWNTIETFILGTNDKNLIKTAAAQSSVPTTLRLMYNSSNLWFYTMDVYAFANNGPVDDGLNPSVISTVPAASATGIPINGSLKLAFSENIVNGSGNITLNGVNLTPGVIGKNITLPYANLKYSTTYTLNVPAGAFLDLFDNPCSAFSLTFTTKVKPAVTPKLFDFVVAQDGSGNGTTIQSAFDAVPLNNASTFLIFVKNGTYNEYPTLAITKNNVSLIGQSRDGVIITGSHYSGLGSYTTSTCQTFEILSDNLYCENITVQNTAGLTIGQAVALKVYGDKDVFKNVKLTGYQDTHLTANVGADRQYYLNCDIRGSVDFIFGNGACFFDNCLLYMQDRSTADVVCAPSTATGNTYGYVFNNCTIDGASSQDGVYDIGRPWQNSPRAVYINTKMNILAASAGWISMSTIPALFAEFGTVNAANNPVNLSARNTSFSYTATDGVTLVSGSSPTAVLSATDAASYSLSNVLSGSDSWDATVKPQTTASPTNLVINSGTLSWDAVDGAVCYLVVKNGLTSTFTTSPSVTAANGSYEVTAVSEFGALSTKSSLTISDISTGMTSGTENLPSLKSNRIDQSVEIMNNDLLKSVDVVNVSGQILKRIPGKVTSIPVTELPAGFYMVNLNLINGRCITLKIIKE